MNNKTTEGYTIERLTKENLADLSILYEAVYGRPAPDNFFAKKYDTAYTGKQFTGYIAYNESRSAVGYYGVIPCFLHYDDTIILAAQSADTMTHPGFRFKGLFVELSNITFDLCRAENIRLVFGFPNQNSLHGAINKLGWKMTETMQCFIIPVKAFPFQKLAGKFFLAGSLYKKYRKWILKKYATEFTAINSSVVSDGYAGVHRDTGYRSYKTYSETMVIQIDQSFAWIKTGTALIIGDMQVQPAGFANVMRKMKRIASALGLQQLQFQTSPGTVLYDLFAAQYQPTDSFPVLFQDLDSGIQLDKIKFTFADIDIF